MSSYMYVRQSLTFGLGVNTQNFSFLWLEQFTKIPCHESGERELCCYRKKILEKHAINDRLWRAEDYLSEKITKGSFGVICICHRREKLNMGHKESLREECCLESTGAMEV